MSVFRKCVHYNDVLQTLLSMYSYSCIIVTDHKGPITKDFFENLTHISEVHFINNEIRIHTDAFEDLVNLRILVIENSVHDPWDIPDILFENNNHLQRVHMNRNNIRGFKSAFHQKKNIIVLDLSDNKISDLEPRLFPASSKLKVLNFSNNKLKYIKSGVFSFSNPSMASINLSHNAIWRIDDDAFQNCNVKKLDLSYNNLTNFGKNAFNGSTLEDLDLSFNQQTRVVPELFERMQNLSRVNLSNNPITIIRPDIPELLSRRRSLKVNLRGIEVKCKCGGVSSDTYDVATNLKVDLDITCKSEGPWDNFFSQCDSGVTPHIGDGNNLEINPVIHNNPQSNYRTSNSYRKYPSSSTNRSGKRLVSVSSSTYLPDIFSTPRYTNIPLHSTESYNSTTVSSTTVGGEISATNGVGTPAIFALSMFSVLFVIVLFVIFCIWCRKRKCKPVIQEEKPILDRTESTALIV